MRFTCLLLGLLLGAGVRAQGPDPELVRLVNSIKMIDNHAHVQALDRTRDKGFDQIRCEEMPPATGLPPANVRFGPNMQTAFKALYGFDAPTGSEEEIKKLMELKTAALQKHGAEFYPWVMDQAGVATVLANRTAMPPELKTARFRWVPFGDALMYPLNNRTAKAVNAERRASFDMTEHLFQSYLRDLKLSRIPPTLDDYVAKVIRATLEKQKSAGAVAVKFEAAYLRSLDFRPVTKAEAARVYAKYAAEGNPGAAEYKSLQDFLFKQIALEAGKLGLAIHIHTGSGCGEFFDDTGADAMLLSPMLNDPELRKTNFVLLHGNGPRQHNIAALIVKPNVFVDMSVMEILMSPPELARALRPWLETMPEHVLFGTDAGPFGPGLDWEETTVIGAQNMRRALALVLTEMVRDGTLTQDRAKEIAESVLRGNAAKLYGIQ